MPSKKAETEIDNDNDPALNQSYTVNELCELEAMSRAKAYRLWQQGIGAERYRQGTQWRVTERARRAYHEKMRG